MSATPRPGPSSREWAQHREVISRLYWEEDKTLKQVVDYMRTHHGFVASERMYKLRLKNWGLIKNLKAEEADRLLDNVYSGTAIAAPTIRGRAIGSKHFKGRLNRAAKAAKSISQSPPSSTETDADSTSLELVFAHGSTSPITDIIDAPAIFSSPETCLRVVWQFSHMQFSNGQWDLSGKAYDFQADQTCMCWVNTNTAAEMLMKDRLSPSNWQLLREAFDQHDVALIKPDISMVWATYHNVLKLSRIGKDLGRVFLRWMTGLSQIRLGPLHPLTVLFATLQKMEFDELRLAADAILRAQFDVVSKHHRPGNVYQSSQRMHAVRKLYEQRALSFPSLQQAFTSCIDEMRDYHEDTDDLGWASWASILLSHLLIHEGRHGEARAVLIALCQWLETFPLPEVDLNSPPDPKGTRLRLLDWLKTHMGATQSSKSSRSPAEDVDRYSYRPMRVMLHLEHILSESGPNGAVFRVFEDDMEMMLGDDLRAMRIADGDYDDDSRTSIFQGE
ncbi:hypothetical protein PG994_007313 [Apiospora phragmitis]|uniref:Clr5 domain-containing protein n=1 Tax=Apiospora phragmitis TaxID=2905665 RepID=A0ABR1V0F7_9PEZI